MINSRNINVPSSRRSSWWPSPIFSLIWIREVSAISLPSIQRPPDNVLFEGGVGEKIRRRLLHECDVHTILRLPTGLFYAQGVKANIVFFERKPASEKPWTETVWVYDFRTGQNFTLKTRQLQRADLDDFVSAYKPGARGERVESEKFKPWSYADIAARPGFSLDIWASVKDASLTDAAHLLAPEVIAGQIVERLGSALQRFERVASELGQNGEAAEGSDSETAPETSSS